MINPIFTTSIIDFIAPFFRSNPLAVYVGVAFIAYVGILVTVLLILLREVRVNNIASTNDRAWRVGFGLFYLLLAGILFSLFILIFHNSSYRISTGDLEGFDLRRFIWVVAWSFVGFFGAAYDSAKKDRWRWLKNDKDPWQKVKKVFWSYITRYLLLLLLLSSLAFGILNAIEATQGYIFYFIAAPVAAGLGFIVDLAAELHTTVGRYLGRNSPQPSPLPRDRKP